MVALNLAKLAESDLFEESERFGDFAAQNRFKQRKQGRFSNRLDDVLKKRDASLKKAGAKLADETLDLDGDEVKFKSREAKSILQRLFNISASFFANRDKISTPKEKQRSIADRIFKIGEGFASKLDEVREGSSALVTKLKNFTSQHADRRVDDIRNLFNLAKHDAPRKRKDFAEQLRNPILDYGSFPKYSQIKVEHFKVAADAVLNRCQDIYNELLDLEKESRGRPDVLNYNNTIAALLEIDMVLDAGEMPMHILADLVGEETCLDARDLATTRFENFTDKLYADPLIYKLVERYQNEKSVHETLNIEQKRVMDVLMLEFKLAGVNLSPTKRQRFIEKNNQINKLGKRYARNIIDSRCDFLILKSEETRLKGVPPLEKSKMQKAAEQLRKQLIKKLVDKGDHVSDAQAKAQDRIPQGSFLITKSPTGQYQAIMRYAQDANLRKEVYQANMKLCTAESSRGLLDCGEKRSLDNAPIARKILQLRNEQAKLLGYKNSAQMLLATSMETDPEKIIEFEKKILENVRPLVAKENDELIALQKELKFENLDNSAKDEPDQIKAWDKAFLSNKLAKRQLGYTSNDTKPYYEINHTLGQMFKIAERLYGLKIKKLNQEQLGKKGIELWDPSVEVIEVGFDGKCIGLVYFDLYNRPRKVASDFHSALNTSSEAKDGSMESPQSLINHRYDRPRKNQPMLLSHGEVTTLFHEFGHALHGVLSEVKTAKLAGTRVSRDLAEFPSQLLESFMWDPKVIKHVARHHKTGKKMPDKMIEAVINSKNFGKGSFTLLQALAGLYDLQLHTKNRFEKTDVEDVWANLINRYAKLSSPKSNMLETFRHIFVSSYPAKYNSYLRADVIADAGYDKFANAPDGPVSPTVGKRFREKVLSKGNSMPPEAIVKSFFGGRLPSNKAFLKRLAANN